MRGAKFLLVLLAAMLIAVAALYVLRKPIAGLAIRQAMAAQGLSDPQAHVTAFSVNQIHIENIRNAHPDSGDALLLQIDKVEVDYRLWEALSKRRVRTIRLGPGMLRVDISADGAVSIVGVKMRSGGSRTDSALPFNQLAVSDLTVEIATPDGVAIGALDAEYDAVAGGAASAVFEADQVGLKGFVAEGATADASIAFANDGTVDVAVTFNGGVRSPYGKIRNAEVIISGGGSSWKDIASGNWRAFNGAADINIGDVVVEVQGAPALAALNERAGFIGGPIDEIAVSGDFSVTAAAGAIHVETGDRPLALAADTGASFVIDSAMGEPIFAYEKGEAALAGVASFRGGDVSVAATVHAEQSDQGWMFNIPIHFGAFDIAPLAVREGSALLHGGYANGVLDFEATARGEIQSASIGRFIVSNAPGAATIRGSVDMDAKRAVFDLPAGNCAILDRVSLKIAGQDMDASLKDARLCGGNAPLAVIDYAGAPLTAFSGAINARNSHYRLGRTQFIGAPPSINLAGRYSPADNNTVAQGTMKGGSVVMNDLLRFDRADAALEFALKKDRMTIEIEAARLRMTEYGAAAKVAPIFASGSMTLADDIARFTYKAQSAGGAPLGAGAGEHNIKTASGTAAFKFDRLNFAPNGLQPDGLAPVLKGIIGLTQGAAEGDAAFSWSPEGIESQATVSFDDITFRGPGLTVTKTVGVNGEIVFSSLWPVATDGAQAITVSGVDFGALQLQDGEIIFDMPGDDTLLVERAIFPWFGGRIGVRGATATFTGGNARAPLRVEGVDLEQILEFVDVQGLSGAGTLNGELPIVVENSRASFVGGRLTAEGPGRISYVGDAGAAAAEAGGDAQIAFDILRDLRYDKLSVLIDGPLDGRLDFRINFEGTGEVSISRAQGRVPVNYTITLDAALLELLNQANLSRNLELQIKQAVENGQP